MTTRDGKVRLSDVARLAEVSLSAASMALADHPRIGRDTKLRVRQAAKQLGYRRPRDLPGREQGNGHPGLRRVGFFLVGGHLQDDVNVELLSALSAAASSAHVRLDMAAASQDDPRGCREHVRQLAQAVDGVMLCGLVDQALLHEVDSAQVCSLVLGHTIRGSEQTPHAQTHVVAFDDVGCGRLATARLLACGHRRVAFVCDVLTPGLSHDRWLAGYRLAHLERGLECDPALAVVSSQVMASSAALAERLRALKERPTAFVVPTARVAALLLEALRSLDLTLAPEQIIFGTSVGGTKRYGLERYPRIEVDSLRLGQVAIEHMLRIRQQPALPAMEILVRCQACNLPALPCS